MPCPSRSADTAYDTINPQSSEDYLAVRLIVATRRAHSVLESRADFVIEIPGVIGDSSAPVWVRRRAQNPHEPGEKP